MEEKYRVDTMLDIDQYGETSVLNDPNHRKEVLAYCRNLLDIMGEAFEGAVSSMYMTEDMEGRKELYHSSEEIEKDFKELEAEMLSSDGAKLKVKYRDSIVWPESSLGQQSLMEVMPHEYLNSGYCADQGSQITRTLLKDREPAKKKLLPPGITVNIELPDTYSQEDVEKMENGLEEFNRAYSRTL